MTGTPLSWHNFLRVERSIGCEPIDLSSEEECHYDEEASQQDLSGQMLFPNSSNSLHDSLIAILSFATNSHLKASQFSKLLDLFHLLLPSPNNLPKTKHSFFKVFEHDSSELKVYYYCTGCWKSRPSAKDKCDACDSGKISFFICPPMVPQLLQKYSRPGFKEKLPHKYSRKNINQNNIEDVYDGSVYRQAEESFLSGTNNISLAWYADGQSPYECSAYQMFPFFFVINELPPDERFKPENIVLAGLWGDKSKPHPNLFLLPIYQEIVKMKEGFQVKSHGSDDEFVVQAIVTHGTCDTPAKATFTNMKGHMGYFSCFKCHIEGEKSFRTGNVMVFPHTDHLELRDNITYSECVDEAIKTKKDYKGVFGPTILFYMIFSNFIASIAIDGMHCIFLGIVKQLLTLWFDSKYSYQPFSLVHLIDKVNDRLRKLNLPHFVQRLPEDVTKPHLWKASLCRTFLQFIALIILDGILEPEYHQNLALLVKGVLLLNQSSVSLSDVQQADECLKLFCSDFQRLYGVRHMSSNMHLLRHLALSVLETGPLFITSCYRLEDLLGKFGDLIHGTTHATLQVIKNLSIVSDLPLHVSKVRSHAIKAFCVRMGKRSRHVNIIEKISPKIYVVGSIDAISKRRSDVSELLSALYPSRVDFQTFPKLLKNSVLYVSSSYCKGFRVSSYCTYQSSSGIIHGEILTFVKTLIESPKYYALMSRADQTPVHLDRYVQFTTGNDCIDLISVSDIVSLSYSLKRNDEIFLIEPVNTFEYE